MPRYIDADEALRISKEDKFMWVYDLTDLEEFLQDVPPADVAPRAEVAREIFGELDKLLFGVLDADIGEQMLCVYLQEYTELQKKYTEVKNGQK